MGMGFGMTKTRNPGGKTVGKMPNIEDNAQAKTSKNGAKVSDNRDGVGYKKGTAMVGCKKGTEMVGYKKGTSFVPAPLKVKPGKAVGKIKTDDANVSGDKNVANIGGPQTGNRGKVVQKANLKMVAKPDEKATYKRDPGPGRR